ncbi:MAG: aldo/keto reductase [Aristaeellaceae bacterium]
MDRILLGKDLKISRMGLGSWAIGGPWYEGDTPLGWGQVDDSQSIRSIHAALDLGVNYIDTANIYGAGHSEEVVGRAIQGRRASVVVSTKFGILCDPASKRTTGNMRSIADVHASVEDSLRRLQTDYIDLLLFHLGSYPLDAAAEVREALEALVQAGKIRYYGWSTELSECAEVFAKGEHCAAFMHIENIFEDYADMLALCEAHDMVSICRSPLCMGLLTGKYNQNSSFAKDDLRGKNAPAWMNYFIDGKPNAEMMRRLDSIRDILTSGGRTLAQGCLAWLWARSPKAVPVPGFRTIQQVQDNAGAMDFGPLTAEQMCQIAEILA